MNGRLRLAGHRDFVLNASTGLLSGLLYLSYVLSFAFLVPIQQAFAGRGKKSGLTAAGFAFAVIAAGQLSRMFDLKTLDLLFLGSALLPPLLLLGAVAFINLKIASLSPGRKILLASALLALLAAPLVMRITSDAAFSSWLVEYLSEALGASGLGEDGAARAQAAVESAVQLIRSGFAALILWLIAGSWWLGSLIAARRALRNDSSDETTAALRLSSLRVSPAALWPTLFSWAFLLAMLLLKQEGTAAIIAWNLALCFASLYAMQGLGVISHLARQLNATRFLRLLAPLAFLAVAFSPAAGTLIMIVLPLIGITEVWFPYRNFKGVSK